MQKFYWNNKQSRGRGYDETVGQATTTEDTVFDKTRQIAHHAVDTKNSVCTSAGKKGCAKMPYSKSEYNFNSIKNVVATDIGGGVYKQSNAPLSKIDSEDNSHPQLPKRSDGGIKTVVRVTSSPLRNEENSSKYQLTTSKSHSDMRNQLQANNNSQHSTLNTNEDGQNTPSNTSNKTNKAPVGSHRVLLKLRRLSGKDTRPKSVHGVENIESGRGKHSNDNKATNDQSDSVSLKGISASRSMHQFYFYNRTWNERSLQKYASNHSSNSHNYENVYSGFQDDGESSVRAKAPPVYENIAVASEYQQNASNNPLIINTLSCSPKSSIRGGSRISIIPTSENISKSKTVQNFSNQNWAAHNSSYNPQQEPLTPIPPERKGRRNDRNLSTTNRLSNRLENNGTNVDNCSATTGMNNDNNHRQLYRSKSCERPKMKDSVRDTFKILSNETSDRLQNNFNRFSTNFTDKFLTSNSIMNKFACGSGSGNGSTRSSNSSYNGKCTSSNSSKMSVAGSTSDYSGSKHSNMSSSSYSSNNTNEQNALQTTSLQQSTVGIKNFIPCVDIQSHASSGVGSEGSGVSPAQSTDGYDHDEHQSREKYGRGKNQNNISISSASSASTMTESAASVTKNRSTGIISEATNETTINSLHQKSLANKMRGIGKKISRFRSRSAERVSQRDRNSPERQEATEYDASNVETTPVNYPSRREDKTSGTHTVITFSNIDDNDLQNACPSSTTNSNIVDATNMKTTSSSNVSASSKINYENVSAIEHQNNLSSIYNGPIIGKARALVDYTPSPYDREALRFKHGDIIKVISMNPSGLWRGMTEADGRVGHFKFINVEMIPQQRSERKRSDRRKRSNASSKGGASSSNNQTDQKQSVVYPAQHETSVDSRAGPQFEMESSGTKYSSDNTNFIDRDGFLKGMRKDSNAHTSSTPDESNSNSRPKSVEDLLRRIGLEEHISVFVLNGYEDLDAFREMEECELDYLGITDLEQRSNIMTAIELLQDYTSSGSSSTTCSDNEEDCNDFKENMDALSTKDLTSPSKRYQVKQGVHSNEHSAITTGKEAVSNLVHRPDQSKQFNLSNVQDQIDSSLSSLGQTLYQQHSSEHGMSSLSPRLSHPGHITNRNSSIKVSRDSGCFDDTSLTTLTINETSFPNRTSPTASDRSSHSAGLASHTDESGIHNMNEDCFFEEEESEKSLGAFKEKQKSVYPHQAGLNKSTVVTCQSNNIESNISDKEGKYTSIIGKYGRGCVGSSTQSERISESKFNSVRSIFEPKTKTNLSSACFSENKKK